MESKAKLKKRGFLEQQGGYTLHFCIPAGQLSAREITAMAEIAQKYGTGQINLTARQSIKIPFISYQDIEKVEEEIEKANLKIAVYGRSISNITACPGSPVCKNSCIETGKLAKNLDNSLDKEKFPGFVKIGIVGCENNCLKAIKNDICIIGKTRDGKDVEYRLEFPQLDKREKEIVVKNEEQLVGKIRYFFQLYEENAVPKEKFSDVMKKIFEKNI